MFQAGLNTTRAAWLTASAAGARRQANIATRGMSALVAELGKLDAAEFDRMDDAQKKSVVARLAPLLESELGIDEAMLHSVVADTVNTLDQRESWERLADVLPAARSSLAAMDETAATPEYHHVRFSGRESQEAWETGDLAGPGAVPIVQAARTAAAQEQAAAEAHMRSTIAAKQTQAADVLLAVFGAAKLTLPSEAGSGAAGLLAWPVLTQAVETVVAASASKGTAPKAQSAASVSGGMSAALAGLRQGAGFPPTDTSRDAVMRDSLSRLAALATVDVAGKVAAHLSSRADEAAAAVATAPGGMLDGATLGPEHEAGLHQHDSFAQFHHDHMRVKHAAAGMSHKRLPGSLEAAAPEGLADAVRTLEDNPTFTPADVAAMAQFGGDMVASGGDGGELLDRDYGLWVSHADVEAGDVDFDKPVPDISGPGLMQEQGVKPEQHWKVDFPVDRSYTSPELFQEHPAGDAIFREGTSGAGEGGDAAVPTTHPLSANITPAEGAALPDTFLGLSKEELLAGHFDGDEGALKGFVQWVSTSQAANAAMQGALADMEGEGQQGSAEGVGRFLSRRAQRAARGEGNQR